MNEVSIMQAWVQGCLDAYDSGTVNLEVCDGIPGNWTLYYFGTREIKRSQALQGGALVRYRCHYQLKTVANGVGVARSMQAQLEALQEMGNGPQFTELPGGQVTVEGLRRAKVNKDGTCDYVMEIFGEYDRYYPGE